MHRTVITSAIVKTIEALSDLRCGVMEDEYVLQDKIAEQLHNSEIFFEKERVLGRGMRVDFLTEDGIAIEVKKGKPAKKQVIQQIERYAWCSEVKGVIVVVETGLRNYNEVTESGKPCYIMGLSKNWGIAL